MDENKPAVNLPSGELSLPLESGQIDEQALPPARRDVELTEQVYYGKPCFILKDPTTLRYYRLRPPEYTIFQMLDGKTSMEQVLKSLAERFPSEEYDAQAVMSFIIMLRGANLLRISSGGNTDYLLKRKKLMTRGFFKKLRTEFLFYRIPVFDPDKLLNKMHDRLGGLIYRRATGIMVGVFVFIALLLLISNFEKIGQRQPLLSWINLLYLAPALLVIKFIHEFGHGLTSKHFGSEVHEMGILFLIFMPCFYCDVSDAWMISQKQRRMWITAGGIIVELILAAGATWLWAFTEPKTVLNQFALNVMIAASVNTILFNGNPLLRYDGYYFLMDLLEIPNLKQKGSGYLWYLLQKYVLGVSDAAQPLDTQGREGTVLGYAVCSAIYRWFIMIAIVTMIWRFLDPYGWGVIGGIMAIGCIYTSFVTPLGKFASYLYTRWHQLHVHMATAISLVLILLAAIYGVLILPVEQSVQGQCIVRSAQVVPVYVTQPGFLELPAQTDQPLLRDGQMVQKDQLLLQLKDPQVEYEIENIRLERQKLQTNLYQAQTLGRDNELAQIRTKLKGLDAQHERAQRNLEKLALRAPQDGKVQLQINRPLEDLAGSYLPMQSRLLSIYRPNEFEAVMAVNHRDIERIRKGDTAEIRLWAFDNQTIESTIKDKPPSPVLKMFSPAFSTIYHGEVATMPPTSSEEAVVPAENTYELVLPVEDTDCALRDGMSGRARVIVEKQTLGRAFYLWLIRTLRQDIRL